MAANVLRSRLVLVNIPSQLMPVNLLGKLTRRALHVLRGTVGRRRPPLEDVVNGPDHVNRRVALLLPEAPHTVILFINFLLHRLNRLIQLPQPIHRFRLVLHKALLKEVVRVLVQT